MPEFYHLINDDKYVDYTIKRFNSISRYKNRFIYLTHNTFDGLKKIKYADQVEFFQSDGNLFIEQLKNNDIVFIHFLTIDFAKIINLIPSDIKIVWICWGGDFYDRSFLYDTYLNFEKESLDYYLKIKGHKKENKIKNTIFKFLKKAGFYNSYYKFRTGASSTEYIFKSAIKKINIVATCSCDHDIIKKYLSVKNAKFYEFFYASTKDLLGEFYDLNLKLGKNILIGNSATISNNHVDVFLEISEKIGENTSVICPLNYGDKKYKNWVIEKGNNILGNSFRPLKNWIELEEYTKLIISCDTMIMYHLRQQAVGNILLGLYLGMKVFLNRKSPLFLYFKEKGFVLFTFQDDFINRDKISIDDNDLVQNRKLIEENWGEHAVNQMVENLFGEFK